MIFSDEQSKSLSPLGKLMLLEPYLICLEKRRNVGRPWKTLRDR